MLFEVRADQAAVVREFVERVGGAVNADEPLAAVDRVDERRALGRRKRQLAAGERKHDHVHIRESCGGEAREIFRGAIVKPLGAAREVRTLRAVSIASWRKPAVAVSINTRTVGPVGVGAVGDSVVAVCRRPNMRVRRSATLDAYKDLVGAGLEFRIVSRIRPQRPPFSQIGVELRCRHNVILPQRGALTRDMVSPFVNSRLAGKMSLGALCSWRNSAALLGLKQARLWPPLHFPVSAVRRLARTFTPGDTMPRDARRRRDEPFAEEDTVWPKAPLEWNEMPDR